jgi:hypothetical protein
MWADAGDTSRRFRLDDDRSILPTRRQDRGLPAHAVRVVAEGLVERRALANRSIEEITGVLVVRRVQVDLLRHRDLVGCVGHRAEDGLAADDDPFVARGDGAGGPEHVLELVPLHSACAFR